MDKGKSQRRKLTVSQEEKEQGKMLNFISNQGYVD